MTRFTCVRNKIDPVIRIENIKIQQQKTIPVYFVMLPFRFRIPVVSMMMSVCCTATFPQALPGGQALDKVCSGVRGSQGALTIQVLVVTHSAVVFLMDPAVFMRALAS